MPDYPPFMNATGNVKKILDKIKVAKTPDRFTHDFLSETLGFTGGSSRPFISLAKRIGLLNADGSPSDLYRRFKNSSQAGAAMAEAIRKGYPELYARNEQAHKLNKKELEGLFLEVTDLEQDSSTLRALVGTFDTLRSYADFSASGGDESVETPLVALETPSPNGQGQELQTDLRFGYTIYLNLPNTSDQAVFNAIFKSLRENLLT